MLGRKSAKSKQAQTHVNQATKTTPQKLKTRLNDDDFATGHDVTIDDRLHPPPPGPGPGPGWGRRGGERGSRRSGRSERRRAGRGAGLGAPAAVAEVEVEVACSAEACLLRVDHSFDAGSAAVAAARAPASGRRTAGAAVTPAPPLRTRRTRPGAHAGTLRPPVRLPRIWRQQTRRRDERGLRRQLHQVVHGVGLTGGLGVWGDVGGWVEMGGNGDRGEGRWV